MERIISTTSDRYNTQFPQPKIPRRAKHHRHGLTATVDHTYRRTRRAIISCNGHCDWSNRRLAANAGVSVAQFKRDMRVILKCGLLDKIERRITSNRNATNILMLPHSRLGGVGIINDLEKPVILETTTTPTPVHNQAVEALAGDLIAELKVPLTDELRSACRKELTKKPANEVGALLKSQWRRWLVIAYLFPVGMTHKFWETTRDYIDRLERESKLKRLRIERVRQESERNRQTIRRPRRHDEPRVSRPHCDSPRGAGLDSQTTRDEEDPAWIERTNDPLAKSAWNTFLDVFKPKVIRQSFETWLKPTRGVELKRGVLFVKLPVPEFMHIKEKYADIIQEAIANQQNSGIRSIQFVVTVVELTEALTELAKG